MLKDLRHALRMLLRAKGWTAVVVVSLALGIGAHTALFNAVNRLLLTRLPVAEAETLVRLRYAGKNDAVTGAPMRSASASRSARSARTCCGW
jgi:hypothetical protein